MNYTVKKGDTLSAIAKANNTTVSELANANNITNPNFITTGQVIAIPDTPNSQSIGNLPTVPANTNQTVKSQIQGISDETYRRMIQDPTQSAEYQNALALLNSANEKIKAGKTKWSDQLDDAVNSLLNMEKFSYDPDKDNLFKQNLESYQQMGQLAAKDTLAKSSALTGGYSSSAGQNVAQQAYNAYLQRGLDSLPEYYNLALSAYEAENERLGRNYSLLSAEDEKELNRYREEQDIANSDLNRIYGLAVDDINRANNLGSMERSSWEYDDEVKRSQAAASQQNTINSLKAELSNKQNEANYYAALYETRNIKKPVPNGGGGYLYNGKAYSSNKATELFAKDLNKILDKYDLAPSQIEAIYKEYGI